MIRKHCPNWIVNPEDIFCATGRNRSDWRMDVFRWELFASDRLQHPVVLGCWQTLTKFVRLAAKHGITVNMRDREIAANEGTNK